MSGLPAAQSSAFPGGRGAGEMLEESRGHALRVPPPSLGEKGGTEWEAWRCSVSRSTVSWGRPKRLRSPIEVWGAVRDSWFSHPPQNTRRSRWALDVVGSSGSHLSVTRPLTPLYLPPVCGKTINSHPALRPWKLAFSFPSPPTLADFKELDGVSRLAESLSLEQSVLPALVGSGPSTPRALPPPQQLHTPTWEGGTGFKAC